MPKIPYLKQRRQTWYIRLRVPTDLLEIYKPKKEILRFLRTRDYKEAQKLLSPIKSEIEAEFEVKRKQLSAAKKNSDVLSGYADHELLQLSRKWLSNIRSKEEERLLADQGGWSEERKREYRIELQQEELAAREEALGICDREKYDGATIATEFLKTEGITFKGDSKNYKKLCLFFSRAIHDMALENLKRFEGKANLHNEPTPHHSQASSFQPQKAVSMNALFEEYLSDPSKKRGASTLKNYTIIRKVVGELVGETTSVNELTRDDCKEIRDFLLKLPSNAEKKTKAETLGEAIKIASDQKLPLYADTTVNMALQKLSAVLDYAVREGYVERNVSKGLYVQEKTKSKLRRFPFDNEQLKKIFNAPLYTGCKNDGNGYNKVGTEKPRGARFWVPIISLWTGMRLSEICQLGVSDVVVQDGVNVILIQTSESQKNGDEEKRVKTEAGIRFVPIHPMLERIGFVEFVEEMKKDGQKRLFPKIKPGPHGNYGHSMSKWFSDFMDRIGAKKDRTSFHSFRHCYRDALREAALPLDAALQLGGWSRGKTDDDYGIGLKPQTLYKYICQISFPDLDLSHLYKKE